MGLILGVFLACIAGYSTYFGVSNFLQATASPQALAVEASVITEAAIGLGVAVGSVTLAIVLTLGNVRDTLRRSKEVRVETSERPTLAA